jgi:hypothetical protein
MREEDAVLGSLIKDGKTFKNLYIGNQDAHSAF